ncbi:hypothetical protein GIB67_008499 [Kingdonia uniflora]|uniref:Enhancer of mRNA-decapping protein 4 n=1 Tax=Kingdonia uniflora TaxID=39325 RepID=A0A7J7LFG8_9MAGN|nr:hypothetical protein GIB67_008499 [Kingdonia uniflora]
MASAGNPNQQPGVGGVGQFDMNKFFKPSSNPNSPNPNHNNLVSYPTPPSSYPPPTGPFSYPSAQVTPFHNHNHYLPYPQDQLSPNLYNQRPIPYPTPLLQQPQLQNPPQNHNPGARLMALLGTNPPPPPTLEVPSPSPSPSPSTGGSEFSISTPSAPPANLVIPQMSPSRLPSNKLPRGRHLIGDHVVYDVDVRVQGEVQPQLEVSPITKYVSDPGLVVGRQIAVNKNYICYGLKLGAIRVLNINTALRSLLRGHTMRVSDMAFFAEDVHLLASASIDGRVFIWNINEGPDEEEKPQITGKIVVAIEIVGELESIHPRICWHSHKQEVLVVGIGNYVLKIDTTKVGKGVIFSAEEPLSCRIDKLVDGIQLVGKHDGEVTDLSMCQWMTSRLVSASSDGTVKIWEDRKMSPVAILRPHDGQPVNSATFLTAPHRPDHIILITGGPLGREVKIWISSSEEGWLLPSDAVSWQCTQTLVLKSSAESRVEEAFFNQVVALPRAGLILLANAKKNAIYVVHIEYGPYPAATRMDYIAEFTVTMPILSLTGTSECLADGDYAIQVYCVQTQAIQQYALDLSQCLPPPMLNVGIDKTDSTVSQAIETPNSNGFDSFETSQVNAPTKSAPTSRYPITSGTSDVSSFLLSTNSSMEVKQSVLPPAKTTDTDCTGSLSPPSPMSPKLARMLSALESPSIEPTSPLSDHGVEQPVLDYSVDRRLDAVSTNTSDVQNAPVLFKHPTHLITPSEILSTAVSSTEIAQVNLGRKGGEAKVEDLIVKNNLLESVMEVKVVGETGSSVQDEADSQREAGISVSNKKEKIFCSQASDLSGEMARESVAFTSEKLNLEDTRQIADGAREIDQPSNTGQEGVQNSTKNENVSEYATTTSIVSDSYPSEAKGKKSKGRNSQVPSTSSLTPSPFNSTDTSNEPDNVSSILHKEETFSQMLAMQEMLNELMSMQKEMQKQMASVVAVPVTKEGKRVEQALGRAMEKAIKANNDALWARLHEENTKREKVERDRAQQLTNLITNCVSKDFPAMLDKSLKKEVAAVGQSVARLVTPALEKAVSSAISESFQKGVGDKTVNQLEKSVNAKLEATVARQIQTQFQTAGKQALQDALKSSFEASAIPAIEVSCRTMFDQVNATFQKGMVEHTAAAQRQFESSPSQLVLALRDTINSVSSMTQTLTGELADGQRKLLAFAVAGANSNVVNPLVKQLSNGPLGGLHDMVEVPLDPTKELSRLIAESKYEEAFMAALQRSDVSIVSWLCSQVDLNGILSQSPLSMTQGVLLALIQQLACDFSNETSRKVTWMKDVALAINPGDPVIAAHVRPIFEQVYQILSHHHSLPSSNTTETSSIRLLMHLIHSLLTSCK